MKLSYPMTYPRAVVRNGLDINYSHHDAYPQWKAMIAGDLRRLEIDMLDDHHLAKFSKAAGISKPKAKLVLEAFFTAFGEYGDEPWLGSDPHGK